MKWTKELPRKSGYYWVDFDRDGMHYDEPRVLLIEVEEDEDLLENGESPVTVWDMDHGMSPEEYGPITKWSDEPIFPPEEEE